MTFYDTDYITPMLNHSLGLGICPQQSKAAKFAVQTSSQQRRLAAEGDLGSAYSRKACCQGNGAPVDIKT